MLLLQHWRMVGGLFGVGNLLFAAGWEFIDGIEQGFGAETTHVQSERMNWSTHNNVIERFHGAIKKRTKVMRGMQNLETA